MDFIEMCVFTAAAFGAVNFATIILLHDKIDDLREEIKELKKEKDNAPK